jgi:hypothetical protein
MKRASETIKKDEMLRRKTVATVVTVSNDNQFHRPLEVGPTDTNCEVKVILIVINTTNNCLI